MSQILTPTVLLVFIYQTDVKVANIYGSVYTKLFIRINSKHHLFCWTLHFSGFLWPSVAFQLNCIFNYKRMAPILIQWIFQVLEIIGTTRPEEVDWSETDYLKLTKYVEESNTNSMSISCIAFVTWGHTLSCRKKL